MPDRATIVGVLTAPSYDEDGHFVRLSRVVKWMEVCAGPAGDLDSEWLRNRFPGKLLYSLRKGNGDATTQERHDRLLRAARSYDLVDLDYDRDCTPRLLNAVPSARRVISWYCASTSAAEIRHNFEKVRAVPAHLYRIVNRPEGGGSEWEVLRFLRDLGRRDTTAFTGGPSGMWTRVLAPHLGSPIVFGAIGEPSEDGELTVDQLRGDYGFPELRPVRRVFGIVGASAARSLSPRIHNAAYAALGTDSIFLPFPASSFERFWGDVVTSEHLPAIGLAFQGMTVSSPHKESAIHSAGSSTPYVRKARSTNALLKRSEGWIADTTDPEGVLAGLCSCGVPVKDTSVAVIGCGGTGRAIAAALQEAGAATTLVNRGMERGRLAVQLLGLPFVPLSDFRAARYSVVINATPVGQEDDRMPFDAGELREDAVVIDHVYRTAPTALIARARDLGRAAIDGRQVLLSQVRRQFLLMTGAAMPRIFNERNLSCSKEDAMAACS